LFGRENEDHDSDHADQRENDATDRKERQRTSLVVLALSPRAIIFIFIFVLVFIFVISWAKFDPALRATDTGPVLRIGNTEFCIAFGADHAHCSNPGGLG
jgi:hypothetical protein